MKTFKVQSSYMDGETEICNTCAHPANTPYRYKTFAGETRGCIASCHDKHVRYSTDADWVQDKRYCLPKWITEARRKLEENTGHPFERCVIHG